MRTDNMDEIVRPLPDVSPAATPRTARGSRLACAHAAVALPDPDPPTSRSPATHDHHGGDPRLAPIIADVRARLAPACAHLPPESFERLVQRIAVTKLRWARAEEATRRRFARWLFPPPDEQ